MSTQQAWYKQFWPWFLIFLPLCAVIGSFTTLKIAMDNSDALVADDYYKQGKAINQDLSKIQYAKQLGMQFSVEFQDNQLLIVQHGGPAYDAALNVAFYHPTLAERDFNLIATQDATHTYRIVPTVPMAGNWEVRLESFDNKWRLQKRLELSDGKLHWMN
ncbi:FixH family protein [Shewanella cyperi]|uniref:FixH family protein n=1 Tax=Shewanella cyperi TaxID=2814292 RepID=A0A974XNL9_9GAMM|nr:FixH family protein [Shewanella cyperi]QSX31664.1 FixH family protein [Shewanella cyperi]QSX42441.1 FixH family protein [Shewanella cyperi]